MQLRSMVSVCVCVLVRGFSAKGKCQACGIQTPFNKPVNEALRALLDNRFESSYVLPFVQCIHCLVHFALSRAYSVCLSLRRGTYT